MGQIEAQGELPNEFAKSNKSSDEAPAPAATPADETLTPDQRASIENAFGIDSIEGAFDPGRGRVYEDPAEAGSPSARSTRREEAFARHPAPVDNYRRH